MEKDNFKCSFLCSTWGICELGNVILDDLLAEEMKRNGISLRQFSSQRRIFKIEDETRKQLIVENIGDFTDFLERNLGVEIRDFKIDDDAVIDLLMKHTFLEAPDALHLSFAIHSCNILATLDERHFLDTEHKKEIQMIDGISILRPSELSKQYEKKQV